MNPEYYQKMNVALAYQFFSFSIATAMKAYNVPNSGPSQSLILKVQDLIKAMNSRRPVDALKENNEERKAIEEFLNFLEAWEKLARGRNKALFMTSNTFVGLKVSLSNTLELFDYLKEKFGFCYLMTSRLNQDNLEHFFGIVRTFGRNNDHPDPKLFSQIFRLLMTYTLVKPPPGSNVHGTELMESLITETELQNKMNSNQEKWRFLKERIVDGITFSDDSADPINKEGLDKKSLNYFGGYVAKVGSQHAKCASCIATLTTEGELSRDEDMNLIFSRDRFGVLKQPSAALLDIISDMEIIILETYKENGISKMIFFEIAENLADRMTASTPVGCVEHQLTLTPFLLNFYLVTRLNFICSVVNTLNKEKSKAKRAKKLSHLS